MTITYRAASLSDIADAFETYASDQIASKRWQTTQRAKRDCEVRAEIWRQAASDLRVTEIESAPKS